MSDADKETVPDSFAVARRTPLDISEARKILQTGPQPALLA